MDTHTIHQWLVLFTAAVCVRGYSYSSVAQSYGVSCDDGQDYQPDPDCGKFWRCANGKPYRFTCPAGLHFNVHISVCDWPENADCGGRGREGSSRYDSYGEDYGQNTGDTMYPYQPGTMAPRYDANKYYTEAPRTTRYRPEPKPRPIYKTVNNYHSGHSSGQSNNYGSGSQSHGQGQSKKAKSGWGSSSNKNYQGGAHGSGSGGYDGGNSPSGGHHGLDYDTDRDYSTGQSYYSEYEYESRQDNQHQNKKPFFDPSWKGGYPFENNYGPHGYAGNVGIQVPPPWSHPPSFNKQPLPWLAQQLAASQFAAGFGGHSVESGPGEGVHLYPADKQPLNSQTIGGKSVGGILVYPADKQPLSSQIIGGKLIIIEQPVGHNPNFQPIVRDGIEPFPVGVHDGIHPADLIVGGVPLGSNWGTEVKPPSLMNGIPVSGGTQVNPIILGKPNVGVSNLGKAFIPIIQKNPQLSHLIGNEGYRQFNPQSQSAVMNDYGLSPLTFGTGLGTGMTGGSIPMGNGMSMINAGGAGVILQPIILGTGSGLSKILLPVKFVTSAASTTPVTTSATTTTTTTTTPAPAVLPVNMTFNIFLPPSLPLPPPTVEEIPLPRGLSGRALPSASSAWPSALLGNPQNFIGYGFRQFPADPSQRCTARRSRQRITVPLIQQSGNALTERRCSALGQLINSFVFVYVETLACVVQVPEIQVTCNAGSTNLAPASLPRPSIGANVFLPPTFPLPNDFFPPSPGIPPFTITEVPLPRDLSGRALPSASSAWPSVLLGNPQNFNSYDFGQFPADPSRRCTARRSTQRITMPLIQQSGNSLTDRKCSALGQLINSFVLVYVENLTGQPDGFCVVQVPEIQVTCNTGPGLNAE